MAGEEGNGEAEGGGRGGGGGRWREGEGRRGRQALREVSTRKWMESGDGEGRIRAFLVGRVGGICLASGVVEPKRSEDGAEGMYAADV